MTHGVFHRIDIEAACIACMKHINAERIKRWAKLEPTIKVKRKFLWLFTYIEDKDLYGFQEQNARYYARDDYNRTEEVLDLVTSCKEDTVCVNADDMRILHRFMEK